MNLKFFSYLIHFFLSENSKNANKDTDHLVYLIANNQNTNFLKSLVKYQVETIAGDLNLLEIIQSNQESLFKIKAGAEGLQKIKQLAESHQLDLWVKNFDQNLAKSSATLDHLVDGFGTKNDHILKLYPDKLFDSGYKRYHQQFKKNFQKKVFNLAGYEGMSNIYKIHHNRDLED